MPLPPGYSHATYQEGVPYKNRDGFYDEIVIYGLPVTVERRGLAYWLFGPNKVYRPHPIVERYPWRWLRGDLYQRGDNGYWEARRRYESRATVPA